MPAVSDNLGVALCLASALGFGLMAILAKGAYEADLDVVTLLAGRFVLAAAVFWAVVAGLRRRVRAPRRTLAAAFALGAIGYTAQAATFFSALTFIDASLASLLLYLYPAIVFAAAVALRREQATRRKAGALGLATGGAALVLLGGGTGALDPAGVALAVGAAVAYSTYILVADGVVARLDPWLLSALVATGAAVSFTVYGAGTGALTAPSNAGWLFIALIALISTVLPVSTFLLGMRRVGPATASIVSTVEPVITVALAMAIFGERLGPLQAAGGAAVLGAVVLLQLRTSSVPRDGASPLATGPAAARAVAQDAA